MIKNHNWTAAALISVVMLIAPAQADTLEEIEATKAKTETLKLENEQLAQRIKELEAKAFSKDSKADDIDQEILLIKAKLDTNK